MPSEPCLRASDLSQMCVGCKSLTGRPLDIYSAALMLPIDKRMPFVERQDHGRWTELLRPMLDEHAAEELQSR